MQKWHHNKIKIKIKIKIKTPLQGSRWPSHKDDCYKNEYHKKEKRKQSAAVCLHGRPEDNGYNNKYHQKIKIKNKKTFCRAFRWPLLCLRAYLRASVRVNTQ